MEKIPDLWHFFAWNDGAFMVHRKKAVTLDDVAHAAKVSPATVSRCLNNPNIVSSVLKSRVQAAIEELQYVPDGAAQALASRRSRMLGAVFPSLDSSLFGGTLEALQSEIAESGYTLVVASSSYDPESEEHHIRNLIRSGVDGLMLIGAARRPEIYDLLRAKGIPYVLAWIDRAEGGHPCIGFDNAQAAANVTNYLLDIGHRRIAVISGPVIANDRAAARIKGITDVLESRGLELPRDYVVQCPFGVDEGRAAFRILMSRKPTPTAIICGSEPFAYGAVFESKAIGLRIPHDVSVTGFDDIWIAAYIDPPLTTVRTPRLQIGFDVARYLLSVLSGKEVAPPRPLGVQLVVRQSTAPPQD